MSSSALPWKWVIEYLADVPDVGTSILSALVDRFPDVLDDPSGAVRERLALRYLEEFSGMACGETPPAVAHNVPSTSASTAKIDPSQTCEEVLRLKVAATNEDGKGKSCLDDGDLHQFILLKRATLPKSSIDLLKEKIVGNFHPGFSYSKECNDLPNLSGPSPVNHLSSNNHSDHGGIKKIIRTMKHANPWLKKLTITRKYRKSKNLANNTRQSDLDGTCNVQSLTTEKTKPNTCEEFHDVGKQSQKENVSYYVSSPNGGPENFEGPLRSEQQHRKPNVLHDDREDLQEVANNGGDDVQLLERSSIPQSSSSQILCIKCSKSGQLLNCSGDGCSRSIHESCLGLLASFEENGLFYCPFCAYRNARVIYEKSKRKAREAQRNLFSFYDIGTAVDVLKREIFSAVSMKGSDQVSDNHNNSGNQDLHSNQQLRNGSGARKHNDDQNACRETIECQTHQDEHESTLKVEGERDHNAKRKALATQISDRFAKRNRRDEAGKIVDYQGGVDYQQRGSSSSRELRKKNTQCR